MGLPKQLLFLFIVALSFQGLYAEPHYGLRYRDSVTREDDRGDTIRNHAARTGTRVQRKTRRNVNGRRRADDCVSGGKAGKGKGGKAGKGNRRLDCTDDDRTYPPLTGGKGGTAVTGFTDDFVPFDDDDVQEPVVALTGEDSTPAPSPGVDNDDYYDDYYGDDDPTILDDNDDLSNDGMDSTSSSSPSLTPAFTPAPSPSVNFDDIDDISNDGDDSLGDRQGGGGGIIVLEDDDETISNDPRQSNDPGEINP